MLTKVAKDEKMIEYPIDKSNDQKRRNKQEHILISDSP